MFQGTLWTRSRCWTAMTTTRFGPTRTETRRTGAHGPAAAGTAGRTRPQLAATKGGMPLASSALKMSAMQVPPPIFIIRPFGFEVSLPHWSPLDTNTNTNTGFKFKYNLRSKYKYRSSNIPSDNLASPESLLHEESVVDRFIKVTNNFLLLLSCLFVCFLQIYKGEQKSSSFELFVCLFVRLFSTDL
mgnify:CR=1 FL=1